MAGLRVVEVGWSSTIQDRGRRGYAHLGVPTGGAVDRSALARANRLVGNPPDAAGLETAGGLTIEATGPLIVATSEDGQRHTMRAGDRLTVAVPPEGMWGYLAVRGGVEVAPVLGSRSHDTLSGLGPPALTAGVVLAAGPEPPGELAADLAPQRPDRAVARLWPGPHLDWFGGLDALTRRAWTVQRDVSRVGVRLEPGAFARSPAATERSAPLASFALVEGAIQITPSDEPIVMLANHPTTGGYPVLAVVDPADLPVVAQARPGSALRFRPVRAAV